jgi:amidase
MVQSFLATFGGMMSENQPWLLRKLIKMDMQKMKTGSADFSAFNQSMDDASDEHWKEIQDNSKKLVDTWVEFFKQYDFFICPLTYGPAFKKCPTGSKITYDGNTVAYMDYVPYSFIINPTGLPALMIPMGLNNEGLPIGIEIVGPHYSEPELLHIAKLLEPLTPKFQRPKGL